jgi:alkylation response protein AidB-like acyl-CoA dehydrogenase
MDNDNLPLKSPIGYDEIFANAQIVSKWLPEKSSEIERSRKLPASVVSNLTNAGVFRMNAPKLWEGPELSSMQQLLVIEELARGDVSTAWCAMVGSDSGIYSGYLEDSVARDLYPHLDVVQAGWVHPAGRAEEVSGGYRVSGEWMFCSGSTHADLIVAGCTVYRDGEPVMNKRGSPEWRLVVAPASHWRLKDTWHTSGLSGTASNDYTTRSKYLLVPEEHTFNFLEPKREGLLWKKPDAILRKMPGVPLGLARQRIDDVQEWMAGKTDRLTGSPLKNTARVKSAIAEAEMMLGSARSYVVSSIECQWQLLERNIELSRQQRADLWLSRLNAFQSARDIVRLLFDVVGADAIYAQKSLLDRSVRDADVMCQHLVAQAKGLENIGALLLDSDDQSASPMI